MELHTPTLLASIAVSSVVTGAAIASIALRRHAALVHWGLALVLIGLAAGSFMLRGQADDTVWIVAGNVCMSASLTFFNLGVCRFRGRRAPVRMLWAAVVVVLVASFALEGLRARVLVVGLVHLLQSAALVSTILRRPVLQMGHARFILMAGALLLLAQIAARLALVVSGAVTAAAVADGSPGVAWMAMGTLPAILLIALGLLLMTQERIESELRQANEGLEGRIRERTEELSAAKDAAEAANRAKSAFLANMSHELRTPMNGVMGMIELVRRRLADPKQVDQLGRALQASRSLLVLLNDILDISKIEAGQMRLERTAFLVGRQLESVHALLEPGARAKGIVLSSALAPALEGQAVLGDPLRFQQVLMNLAGNAVKFTSTGTVHIAVTVDDEGPQFVQLRVAVADTGIGIDSASLERIFDAFEQADASSTRRYGGSGLGLAISRRLVRAMGGEIGVRSEPGLGSTFWFSLRLDKAETPAAQAPGGAAASAPDVPHAR